MQHGGARQPDPLANRRSYARELVLLAAIYYVVARLGLQLSLVGHSVTPLWPPTGLAVYALLTRGKRLWPAIAVAAFLVNGPISPTWGWAVMIAAGNTLAPLFAAALLEEMGFRAQLQRVSDAVALVFVGALLSMAISATIGSLALLASGAVPAHNFAGTWSVWWTGDAMGVLIVAPFLWSIGPLRKHGLRPRRALEAAAIFVLLVVTTVTAVVVEQNLLFLVLPILGWTAWRFEQRGAGPSALLVSTIATLAAVHNVGSFAHLSLVRQMVTLQSFNAAVAFTAIVMTSAVSQRERRAERERDVVSTLQRSLLPERAADVPGIAAAVRYIPASTDVKLGGDWYDVIPLSNGRIGIAVGDVAGHGVAAAAVMGQIRMSLRAYALDDLPPAESLRRLNHLLRTLAPGAMATVWYGVYDPAVNVLSFANAGHVPALLLESTAEFLEERAGPPLGAVDAATYAQYESALARDAVVVLYTDGLVEVRGESIDVGLERLRAVAGARFGDLDALCDHIVQSMLVSLPADDVAVLAIRPRAHDPNRFQITRPARPGAVTDARHSLESWLRQNGVGPTDAFEIVVSVSEACANAVQHAYGLTEGTMEVDIRFDADDVVCEVIDRGHWRDPAGVNGDRGRGIVIMRGLMDDVELIRGEQGTTVRMRRRRRDVATHA